MKKFKKIYITILFSALMAFSGIMLNVSMPQKDIAFAQNTLLPANATFQKYIKWEEDDFEKINNTQIFHQDAVFLKTSEVAIFEIGNPNNFFDNPITDIVLDVYLDSEAIEADVTIYNINGTLNEWAQIVFDPYKQLNPSEEGKYEIQLEYFDKNVIKQTVTFTFYLYKQSTYFTGNFPAVNVQNENLLTPAMESASFARTYEYHYTNDYTFAQNLSLPTITFDSKKFEVSISKNHSGVTQTTYISLNENGEVQQTLPIVLLKKESNSIIITFNDIGAYTINYYMMYSSSSEKFLFTNINSKLKSDRMQLYGFQIFHSNINATSSAEQQKEFKVINSDNTIDPNYQTDITFTQIQSKYLNNTLQTPTGATYNGSPIFTFENIDSRVVFNGKNLTAKSTNQAPVSFKHNASLITTSDEMSNSYYYKLHLQTEGENLWTRHAYNGKAFTDEGTYLVKLSFLSDLSVNPSVFQTQWFYFTISNQIPNYSIKADGQTLSTGSYTKEVVEVSFLKAYNPFDSASKLSVYRKESLDGVSTLIKEVAYDKVETFRADGIYTVELSRGSNFQSKSTSQFIIDTSPITNLEAVNVRLVNNTYVKSSSENDFFYTNQAVSVEWDNKTTNNNTVSGFYKYIPLTQISSFSHSDYVNYYAQENLIPVPYKLNYKENDTLSIIPYSNTKNLTTLSSSNIFTQEGLYMIRAVDKAGNEAYTYFFIDKTAPVVLQKDKLGNYLNDYSKLNIVSETVTIEWGKYKVIQTDLNLENINFDTWLKQGQTTTDLDPWLFKMLKEKANNAQLNSEVGNFKRATLGGKSVLHFSPKIDTDNIEIAIGSDDFVKLSTKTYEGLEKQGTHSAIISATKLVNGVLIGIETSYTFRINDISNKNENFSTIYSIITSTDVSKTQIKFKSDTSVFEYDTLTQHNYRVSSEDVLQSYYIPINTDVLQLQFLTTMDESSIEIETVNVLYYPYITNYWIYTGNNSMLQKNTFYTPNEQIVYTGETNNELDLIKNTSYSLETLKLKGIFLESDFKIGKSMVLAKTPIEINVYNYNTNVNLATDQNGVWVWDINLETIYVSAVAKQQTMAGKYEVVRTYRQTSEISSVLIEKADYKVRHLTFIVEREDVISKGIDKENSTFSLVGGSAYIEILAGDASSDKFTALYLARAYTKQQQNVLIETNKLPVKLGFPVAKFGQVINEEFNLLANNYFYANHIDAYINSFEMGIRVTHLATGAIVSSNLKITLSNTQPASQYTYVKLDNGIYLIFENAINGYLMLEQNFTQEGKYQVDFFQKNTAIKGNSSSISLFFQITHIAPNFDIVDAYGETLPKHDTQDIYYTNQEQVTITWIDSTNPYYAKINKSEIYYTGSNNTLIKLSTQAIHTQSDGITHWFTLPTLIDGQEIIVKMQYEGKQADYSPGPFSKTKTIIVDKTAPTTSINNLIEKMNDISLFTAQSLREGHNQAVRYNRTITTTHLAEFAFPVDISNLETLILSNLNNEVTRIYYREVDKYTNPSFKEFDPTQNDALLQIQDSFTPYDISSFFPTFNRYYEFVELDKARNITIYTIYLTDIASSVAQEESEKSNQQTLNDDWKVIEYTNYQDNEETQTLKRFETALTIFKTNYNVKIYAKQFFNLNAITPYGYQWYLLTFGTNKYLASPALETGKVYKIQGGTWTPVNLANEIYLTVSRSNYTLQIKNLPTNNINLSVVVSNEKLTLQAPQANNSTLTITNVKANDTDYVKWETVSIWEYQNGVYSAFAKFDITQTDPVEREPETEGFNLATYTINGNLTIFNITTKNQAYYRFKIVDNFGLEYVLYYLAGTQFVEKIEELEGRELITDNTFENTTYYLSNVGFKYTYYPALTQSVEIKIFALDKQTLEYNFTTYTLSGNFPNVSSDYLTISYFTNYITLTLKVQQSTASDKYNGDLVMYHITSTTLAPTAENQDYFETETTSFKINSITPKTILTGKNKQDLSDILLRNEGLISEPITISFATTEMLPYPVKVFLSFNNQTSVELQSGQTFSEVGTYQILKVFTGAMGFYTISSESFSISDQASAYFSVVQYDEILDRYVEVALTSLPYKLEAPLGAEQTSITQHFIVNTTDWKINLSASQFMQIVPNQGVFTNLDVVIKNGVSTFIRTISNHDETPENNKSFNYYKTTIAITYIPKQNKIVRDFYYLDNQANQVFLTNSEKTHALIKEEDFSNQLEIYWSNFHLIPENKITASIYFGQDKQQISSTFIKTKGSTNYITLTRSGNYSFVFEDMSGNVHKFDYNSQITNSSSSYEFVFLSSVIFTVNNQAPIQYAIYNSDVQISLPSHTLSYYDNNARPTITVTRDLEIINDYTYNQSTRTYTFTKPGLYKVLFKAKISGKEIKQEVYYFEIIKEREIAWVFNIEKYGNYYIEKIEKNNVDITTHLVEANLGEKIIVKQGEQTVTRLKNLAVSLFDEQTGSGIWKITINTNNDLNQSFTFSFTISDTNPPIVISHPEGTKTTDIITVSFNSRNLYENVGEVVVKIGSNEIYLNEEYFEENNPETQIINISTIGDTYVQIYTPSGRLLYSYRVTRAVPLNTVAIIVIVVSSLAAIGLTVMFVLLRRRMKIR